MTKQQVYKANAQGDMSSLGNATYKLFRQHNFPYKYDDEVDTLTGWDHDRCFQNDYEHARAACSRHLKIGEMFIPQFVENSDPDKVIAFFVDILKAKKNYSDTKWTGFRLMGTINVSNGFPVYTMELFAKGKDSKTKVYSDSYAPNVNQNIDMNLLRNMDIKNV